MLGVALVEEAVELRNAGVQTPILVLNGSYGSVYELIGKFDLTPAVFRAEHLTELSRVAGTIGRSIPVHLKVDTGLNRIGASLDELPEILELIRRSPGIELEGVFSHLANADGDDERASRDDTRAQVERFSLALEIVQRSGPMPRWCHLGNSAGMLDPALESLESLTMARPGLLLYGYPPSSWLRDDLRMQLRPVLSWQTQVLHLKTISVGERVSYGGSWTASRTSRIATLPVGYADGFSRHYSNKAHLLIRGCRAPLVGRVGMDMCMLDVTDVPLVAIGDRVTLIGSQGDERITATDLADLEGTIQRELLCRISPRVPRICI